MAECPEGWCGPWVHGLCVDCGKPRRLGDPPVVPLSREWCDGTPHAPDAIPPLPFHDWRFDVDNPWSICARCGAGDAVAAEFALKVHEAESKALAEHIAGTCHLSEWSCSHCEACIAPPENLCTDTGCWDADRCVVRTAGAEGADA